jgi:hypothetical protein
MGHIPWDVAFFVISGVGGERALEDFEGAAGETRSGLQRPVVPTFCIGGAIVLVGEFFGSWGNRCFRRLLWGLKGKSQEFVIFTIFHLMISISYKTKF